MVKGNVAVAVRVRPLSDAEQAQGGTSVVTMQGESLKMKGFDRMFTFDFCFPPCGSPSSQEEVYATIGRDLTRHALQGFNTCIFAYGQTGSGKTHTMMGSQTESPDPGIVPRLCNDLFSQLQVQQQREHGQSTSVKCEVSFFEIYNERVNCLLSEDVKEKLKVREHPVTGPYVEGLTKKVVESYEHVHPLISQGNLSRTVAATRHNLRSSRSHAVFTIIITQTIVDVDSGQCVDRVSRVNLVDLAGSERLPPNQHQTNTEVIKDGININKSLSTLGRVIHALSEKGHSDRQGGRGSVSLGDANPSWVAYRDSVLTWLLKENLGGNSKTVMLACISPSHTQFEETLNTIRYADRVKRIRNHAVVNEDQKTQLVEELYREIRALRGKLADQANAAQVPRRASYSEAVPKSGGEQDWSGNLDSSEGIIQELNLHWERKLELAREVYHEQLTRLRGGSASPERMHSAPGSPVTDTPLLVSLDPHLVPGEFVSWCIPEGDTVVTTTSDELPADGANVIRLCDGVNLCDPHCLLTRDEEGVKLSPGTGSITFVDGQLLTDTVLLSHATRLIFGSSHAFYFLNPLEAKRLRDARKGERVPKVLDWAYASNEFAQVMDCYKPYEEVVKLQDEVEYWRSLTAEGQADSDACAACCLILVSDPRYIPNYPKPGLIYPLREGRNRISAEEWGLKDLGEPFCVDVVRGQVFRREPESSSPAPLWHGAKIHLSGGHTVVVNCPCSPIEQDLVPHHHHPKQSPRKHSPRVVPKQLVFREEETDALVHSVMDLQYQMLAMHDVLFCLPPELGEISQEELETMHPPNIVQLVFYKRGLKNSQLLETPSKQLTPLLFRDHLSRLTTALRELTHAFTHRLDHPAPDFKAEAEAMRREKELQKQQQQQQQQQQVTDSEEELKAMRELISRLETEAAVKQREFENRLRDLSEEKEEWEARTRIAQDELRALKLAQTEEGTGREQLQKELDSVCHRLRLTEDELASARLAVEDSKVEKRLLERKMEDEACTCASLRQTLADTTGELQLLQHQKKSWVQKEEKSERNLASVVESGKRDKKQMKKLQQQVSELNLTLRAHKARESEAPAAAPHLPQLETVIQHIKTMLLPLGLAILPVVERIASDIQAKGSSVPQRAWHTVHRVLQQQQQQQSGHSSPNPGAGVVPVEATQIHDKTSAARGLRELAVYYDMHASPPDPPKDNVYVELAAHAAGVMQLTETIRTQMPPPCAAGNNPPSLSHHRPVSPLGYGRSSATPDARRDISTLKRRLQHSRGPSPQSRHPSPQPTPRSRPLSRTGSAGGGTRKQTRSSSRHSVGGQGGQQGHTVAVGGTRVRRNTSRGRTAEHSAALPATTASLRSELSSSFSSAARVRSDSSTRLRGDSPRTQLAARLLQRT